MRSPENHTIRRLILLMVWLLGGLSLPLFGQQPNPVIRITTSMGAIDAVLYQDKAPLTVANVLQYVEQGHYNGTIFHRVIPNFMIQGGGYTENYEKKPVTEPVQNEAYNGMKNTTGTLAMARTANPHSATAQFFINVNDNDFLDFKTQPHGPVNTLRQSVFGIKDSETGRIATTNCRGLNINRQTLVKAASAKPDSPDSYECLMKAVLAENDYSIDKALSNCLANLDQLKQQGKLAADQTCTDYVNNRHKGLQLINVYWGYTVFGKVVNGMEIVNAIAETATGPGGPFRKDAPKEMIVIQSIQRINLEQTQ